MFERSLSSLIKGLRSHRGKDEAKYVATVMDEIKVEMRSADMDVKGEAVLKLTYLHMLGYSPSNASFHMLEVMSSPRYHLKTVGYLATSQCFSQETDVLILATNMLKKDLRSANHLDVAIALNGLAHIVIADLAQHLAPDIIALLSHTRAVIRKKAVLVLHAMINHHPPVLDQALPRIIDKLKDTDTGVASATVNIMCELSRHDEGMARSCLNASPQLFELLTTSSNNWLLIKIVKLFGVLTPLEPRLTRRLLPPLSSLIQTTPAMSLLYECIQTVIIGGMLSADDGDRLAATCSEKFGAFLDDDDQNLRYIALLGLVKILPSHPYLVAKHQDRIFRSMDDEDLSIRLRSLDLVSGMANRENFIDIVEQQLKYLNPGHAPSGGAARSSAAQSLRHLMSGATSSQAQPAEGTGSWLTESYRLEIIHRILSIGSQDTYANIVDFEWYVDILIQLDRIAGASIGALVCSQLIDIAARVKTVRPHAVNKLKRVLEDPALLEVKPGADSLGIVRAAAWICGEYCQEVAYPPAVISLLLRVELLRACSDHTTAVVVQNAIKLLAWWLLGMRENWNASNARGAQEVIEETTSVLADLSASSELEVRERASQFLALLQMLQADLVSHSSRDDKEVDSALQQPRSLQLLSPLFFSHALGPVARKAQSKVAAPEGIDLDQPLVDRSTLKIDDGWLHARASSTKKNKENGSVQDPAQLNGNDRHELRQLERAEKARLRAEREKREKESPFYIGKTYKAEESGIESRGEGEDSVDDIPIVQLTLNESRGEKAASTPPASKATAPVLEEEEMPEKNDEGSAAPITVRKAGASGKKKKKRRGRGVDEAMLET